MHEHRRDIKSKHLPRLQCYTRRLLCPVYDHFKKTPCLLDILYYIIHSPSKYYLLTGESVFKIGFSPGESLESLSIMSAGASAPSRQ